MRIHEFCFLAAIASALTGICLGIMMGISSDFTLAPAHAHLNLLGWVTLALYGLYHRGAGRTGGRLPWVQVATGAVGAVLMAGGLAAYLGTGDESLVLTVVVGSLLVLLSMLLFLVIVIADMRRGRVPAHLVTAQPG